jgi:hypothetical protein
MNDSKSGSKSDLNESNMPLLEDDQTEKAGETPEKEQIEMTEEGVEEKDDSKETEKEKKKKKKKEKKKKEPKEKKPKGPNCVQTLSAGLNLTDRDGKLINTDVCLDFDDVLAEPGSTHGLDPVWQISFILFTQTKLWLYRIFAALVAVPAALVWALVFSLITVVYVWILAPALRLFELGVAVARRVFVGVMRCTVEPVCLAVGAIFSQIGVSQRNIV